MQKIEHIGIAVSNLDHGEKVYSQILGVLPYKREEVEEQGVITSFFRCGSNKIELLQSTVAGGVIDKFIERKGEGIHHIAFAVTDILKEMERLRIQGFQILQEEPIAGADNKWICFVHPKDTQGVLIELCQERNQ